MKIELLIIALLSFNISYSQFDQLIPAHVKKCLNANFNSWELPDSNEVLKYNSEIDIKFYYGNEKYTPYFIGADFNGDSLIDYAMLLKYKNVSYQKDTTWQINLMILDGDSGSCLFHPIERWYRPLIYIKGRSLDMGIGIINPGMHKRSYPYHDTIEIKTNSIGVIKSWGLSIDVIVWNEKYQKFERINFFAD